MRQPRFDKGKGSSSNSTIRKAIKHIADEEGFLSTIYQHKGDVPTVGYGFTAKEDLHNWTEPAARLKLGLMVLTYDKALRNGRIGKQYINMTPNLQIALMDLIHQGGLGVLDSMPNFVKAVQRGDYVTAANELDFGIKLSKPRVERRQGLFRPTMPQRPVNYTTPTVQLMVDNTPKYTVNPYVKAALDSSNLGQGINVPYDAPAPVHMPLFTIPMPTVQLMMDANMSDITKLLQPKWIAQ